VIPNLRKFEILKNKKKLPPEQRDLNRLKSLSELEAIVDKFDEQDLQSQAQQTKSMEQQMYEKGHAKLIHDDAQIKVVQPLTEKGSCYFGINTKWCTAGKEHNQFSTYSRSGPLYIVLIKKENKRYQFHWAEDMSPHLENIGSNTAEWPQEVLLAMQYEASQFMNELDQPINPNEIAEQYPVLWKIFGPIAQKNHSLVLNPNLSFDLIKKVISKDPDQIRYLKNPSTVLQKYAVSLRPDAINAITNPSPEVQQIAVSKRPELLNSVSLEIKKQMIKRDPINIRYIENPDPDLQIMAVKDNPYVLRFIHNAVTGLKDLGFQVQSKLSPEQKEQLQDKVWKSLPSVTSGARV
jgi:hypothetical protein